MCVWIPNVLGLFFSTEIILYNTCSRRMRSNETQIAHYNRFPALLFVLNMFGFCYYNFLPQHGIILDFQHFYNRPIRGKTRWIDTFYVIMWTSAQHVSMNFNGLTSVLGKSSCIIKQFSQYLSRFLRCKRMAGPIKKLYAIIQSTKVQNYCKVLNCFLGFPIFLIGCTVYVIHRFDHTI